MMAINAIIHNMMAINAIITTHLSECPYTSATLLLFILYYVYSYLTSSSSWIRVSMNNRAVMISGCDTGFGNLTAKRLDAMGIRVFAGCLTEQGCNALDDETSPKCTTMLLDVTRAHSVSRAADIVAQQCRAEGVEFWALINNAGVVCGALFDWTAVSEYERMIDVNYLGTVRMCKSFIDLLRPARGRIINIASVAGRIASPGMTGYAASKFAVEGFSDSLRSDLRDWGVDVVVIEPGFFDTPLVANSVTAIESSWRRLPRRMKELYGYPYLDHIVNKVKMVTRIVDKPDAVVDTLVCAVSAWRPRLRYSVGRDAFLWIMWSYLPSRVSDVLFSVVRNAPKPEGVGL